MDCEPDTDLLRYGYYFFEEVFKIIPESLLADRLISVDKRTDFGFCITVVPAGQAEISLCGIERFQILKKHCKRR